MAVSLEMLKNSLRVDDDADDALLTGYLDAAKSFVKNAVGADEDYYVNNTRFDTAVLALASTYYTYRMTSVTGTVTTMNATMNALISQMRGEVDATEES